MATPDTVRQYYGGILFRDPSEAEVAGWSAVIDNSVVSLEQARAAFIASPEAADIVAPIVRLYQSAFGRVPDRAGLDFWADAVRADPAVLDTLALQFSQSAEGRSLYGPGNDVNVPFLTALYLNVLGRAPDTEGFNFWLGSGLGRDQVLLQFSESAENKARSAPGVGRFLDNSAQGTETFSGDLYDAAHGGDAPETPTGETFGLTSSVDKVAGTAGNDTISAVISATAGATTLTGLDQIDGGEGEDTLNIADDQTLGVTALPAGSKVQNVEALNVTSNRDVGSQSSYFDSSSFTGLKTGTVSADAAYLKAAGSTDLTVTANKGPVDIVGGNTVVVASAGDATVAGARSVTIDAGADALVTGGTTVAVTSTGAATVNGAQDVTIDAGGTADVSKATGAVSVKSGGEAKVSASETSDVTVVSSGAGVTVDGARTVSVVANGDVSVSGAAGAVTVDEQDAAAKIDVSGGTAVSVIGIGSDLDAKGLPTGSASSNTVTIGAAPSAVSGPSTSGFPEVLKNLASNPTGDVAVDFSTAYTDADGKAGIVFGTGKADIYTNGAATVSATGVGPTVITDVQTTPLRATGSAAPAPGTSTLATVNLDGLSGNATVTSDALADLSVLDTAGNRTVTVVNNTKDHALGLTVGNTAATIKDAAAASIAIATQASAYQVVGGLAVGAGSPSTIALDAAKATSVTSSGDADLNLDLTANAAQTGFDGSAATGDIVLTGLTNKLATVSTGSGDDSLTVTTATVVDNTATKDTNEAVSASVSSGDGKDAITVATTGSGTTTVVAGAGDDTVTVAGRSSGVLTVNLGDGDDSFASTPAVGKNDVVDGGAGSDTLLLRLVGSANVGAFRNFDVFDAKGLSTTLDTSLLAAKNTVAEFVASGTVVIGAELTNVGAGVGFRVTGDMGFGNSLALTQRTAGAITVTLDADEAEGADGFAGRVDAGVDLKNATAVKAVFDTVFADTLADVTNVASMGIGAANAASLEVVSDGAEAVNSLGFSAGAALTSAKVSGAQALNLTIAGATSLASVDASAHTGGLTFSLANLDDEGTVTLGSGRDVVTATNASTDAGVESVALFEKAAAAATSTATTADEVAARDAAIADADQLVLAGADVAADTTVVGGAVANGVLEFTDAGPATLDAALAIADFAATTAGQALLFEYAGSSYVFVQGATDTVVRLADVTGVTSLIESDPTQDYFVIA